MNDNTQPSQFAFLRQVVEINSPQSMDAIDLRLPYHLNGQKSLNQIEQLERQR